MKTFSFIGVTILFVVTGCGGSHSSTDEFITVDVNESYSTKKELVLQDFMDVEYIPLETNDEGATLPTQSSPAAAYRCGR